ncbi:MAG: glutathione S-transferase family protein [Geminicoccaceae bacterium]
MSDVTIYGIPQSTYVRSCRMTCIEKGVGYDLDPLMPQSEEMLALNPTGRVPALRHGDLLLQETSAIARYIDEAFPGSKLQPDDAAGRAQMNLWMSLTADNFYQTMIRDIVLPRLGLVEKPEEAIVEAGKTLEAQLKRTDETLQQRPYLAGDALSLADLFLAPILFWIEKTPEGQAALLKFPALNSWYGKIGERKSFKETDPPMPG